MTPSGILLLDKPEGLTSNGALQRVRRCYGRVKGGHTGSLDPMATGMLPICLGEATKYSGYLIDSDKVYLACCRLGARTDTGDRTGQIVEERPVPLLTDASIEEALTALRGDILQIPPMYSALHINGKRLYKLAREGKEVDRPARPVTVHEFKLVDRTDSELTLSVHCSKGTYVRTLAEDLARGLGCCGHLIALRRISVNPFSKQPMITLPQLEALESEQRHALLLPVDAGIGHLQRMELSSHQSTEIGFGRRINVSEQLSGLFRIYGPGGGFIGLAEVESVGVMKAKRLLSNSSG